VCKGVLCPFAAMNEERCLVCTVSGRVVSTVVKLDDSALQNAATNDSDMLAGETVGGGWAKRKDNASLSTIAFRLGDVAGETDVTEAIQKEKRKCERGGKRQRTHLHYTSDQVINLHSEALVLIDKLLLHENQRQVEEHGLDVGVLLDRIKAYRTEATLSGRAPCANEIHNIVLEFEQESERPVKKTVYVDGEAREKLAALVSNLWLAVLCTPYMAKAKRSTDSFRPFVSGVLFGLKRGVKLPSGKTLIPVNESIAAALPAVKTAATNPVTKALQAASHRGLCTLHRAVSSCSDQQAEEIFTAVGDFSVNLQA
jgi:hypothetical protein